MLLYLKSATRDCKFRPPQKRNTPNAFGLLLAHDERDIFIFWRLDQIFANRT